MKSSKLFALPLSNYMCDIVRTAITIGDLIFPATEWLFTTRSKDRQQVIATQVWKEKSLPSDTGHILRHTYRTIAETTAIPPSHSGLLVDHALGGMDNVYVDKTQLFSDLLESQEAMTRRVLELCKASPPAQAQRGKRARARKMRLFASAVAL